MRFLGFFFLTISFSFQLLADTKITSQIHDVDLGSKMGDEVLLFLKSGDVARLKHWDLDLIESLQNSKSADQWFEFSVDKNRMLKKVKVVASPKLPPVDKFQFAVEEETYIPTTIASMEITKDYISESRRVTKAETQCFNRAMIWSYEWWRKHSLKSNKVFVFWPKEYVRKYSFKWWFHVAPYVHVMDSEGIVRERVLDVKWSRRPQQFQEWADYHSSHDVKCRVVEKYSEYADFPFDADRCYFMRANMYTWQPADLEMKEAWGYTKNAFNMVEVKAAYLEAFDITL